MGRHVWFRTPTKTDRLDIFDLYLDKVGHEEDLDSAEASRRARPRHERLLAGHDRAGLLDGAHDRAPRRATRLRLGRHRRGHDDGGVRDGDRHQVRPRGDAGRRDPRGRPRCRRPRVHEGSGVDAAVDQAARSGARPPPGAREGGAVQLLALGRARSADLGTRSDGRRAGLLRRELDRRRRRRPERDRAGGLDGRRVRDGAGAGRARRERERPADQADARCPARQGQQAARGDRDADHEPHRVRRARSEATRCPECSTTGTSAASRRSCSARRT